MEALGTVEPDFMAGLLIQIANAGTENFHLEHHVDWTLTGNHHRMIGAGHDRRSHGD